MKISKSDLQGALQQSLIRHYVPGASMAVLHGDEVTAVAAGVANTSTGVEVTPETVMHIGSITKVFNATLVMQLVDEGRVDLEERVVRYLPDLRLKDGEALEQITVKMLLNHTSGIDGNMLPDHGHDEETIEKAILRFAELGQIHRPGAEFSYCNPGTVIAGYLVQRMRGESWYRLVKTRIFEPLNLEYAVTLPEEALLHRASVGHHLSAGSKALIRTSFAFLPLGLGPAGTTLMMSARELIEFAKAHIRGGVGANGARILSERSASVMQHMTVDNRGKGYTYADGIGADGIGIGWMVFEGGLLTHVGAGPGFVSVLYAHPEREFAAAILTNAEHGLGLINEFMEPWLKEVGAVKSLRLAADTELPPDEVPIDPTKYVGSYEDLVRCFQVSRTADGLELSTQAKLALYDSSSTAATSPARLIPLANEKFLLSSDAWGRDLASSFRVVTFRNPNAQGEMQHLGFAMHLYPRVSH